MPSLIKKLSEEEFGKFKNILKEIIGKERCYMPNFDKFMVSLLEEKEKEMMEKEKEMIEKEKEILGKAKEVEAKARKKGEKEGIAKTVIEMIKYNLSDKDIMKYTHITKKELEKLKLKIA